MSTRRPSSSSDRPRVLLTCGPTMGGIRRHLDTLAAELPRHGCEVAFAGPSSVRLTAPVSRFPVELADRPRPLRDVRALFALKAAARSWKADLIHAQGVKAALLALLAFPALRPPVVVTFQNLWHGGPLTVPLRLLAPRASAAIAVSAAVRESLLARGVRPRAFRVIYNSVDLAAFFPAPGREERPFTATFLGRLTEEKGIRVLLEAARRLASREGLRLVVAGDGPLRAEVEREADRPGTPLVFLGPQTEVLPVLHGADAVLMPSMSEGLGITALEAMACALPVVASRVGGLPEAVAEGETGLLVPPGDAEALARAVEELAASPERAQALGSAGRRRVEQEFGQEQTIGQLLQVYAEILDGLTARRLGRGKSILP